MVLWIKHILIIILICLVNAIVTKGYQAPAEIILRIKPYKLASDIPKNEIFKVLVCVDKNDKHCYYNFTKDLLYSIGKYAEIKFVTDNMNAKLAIMLQLKNKNIVLNFQKRLIELRKIHHNQTFEIHSLDLQTVVRLQVSHKCELHYYPVGQCNVFCFERPKVHTCDEFGNKICNKGLVYNKKDNRCVENNCQNGKNICQNGGFCVNLSHSFMCMCEKQFTGEFCELINPCHPNPCKNNAICHRRRIFINLSETKFVCSCTPGFYGDVCDKKRVTTSPVKSTTNTISNNCSCPKHMRCQFVGKKQKMMCVEKKSSMSPVGYGNDKGNLQQNRDRESRFYGDIKVSTVSVVGIGCIIFLSCVVVTLVVFFQTRNRNNYSNNQGNIPKGIVDYPINRHDSGNHHNFYPSTQYSQFSPSTFKRASSLMDQNSAYLFTGSPDCGTIPGPCYNNNNGHPLRLSSSIQSNSYQEAPSHSNQMLASVSMAPIPGFNWQAASNHDIQQTPLLTSGTIGNNSDSSTTKQPNYNSQSLPRGRGTSSVISLDSDAPSLPPRPVNLE